MIESGLVQVASHSYSHKNLVDEKVNLEEELVLSKKLLEEKLSIEVDSFVYPFGKYNQKILNETMKHYQYSFRIGNGINKDFNGINGVIYRIDGDNLENGSDIFSFSNMAKFRFKSFVKSIVGNR
jgi:peptidoglycan/xylan/chitin deacetylase (PgdA/CDA1 family)